VRVADIIQNIEDFEFLSEDLQKRFILKSTKIIEKFKDRISLVEVLESRLKEIRAI
jgi:hypothetical protein